jgi:hypothetical protein
MSDRKTVTKIGYFDLSIEKDRIEYEKLINQEWFNYRDAVLNTTSKWEGKSYLVYIEYDMPVGENNLPEEE